MSPSTPTRHGYIDSLRGLAIIGVMTVHVAGLFQLPFIAGTLAGLGLHGVQMFFVISALTLMMSWRARAGIDPRPVFDFYLRRLFRIAPMFWLGIVVFALLHPLWRQFWQEGVFDAKAVLLTTLYLHGWSPDTVNTVVPGGWTIGIEMNFYLLFPLLAAALSDIRKALLFTIVAMVVSGVLNGTAELLYSGYDPGALALFLYFWLPNQMPCFGVGFAAYYAIGLAPHRRWLPPMLLAGVVMFGLVAAFVDPRYAATALQPVTRGTLIAIATALLAVALAQKPYRFLVNPTMRQIGKVSFSAYLVHFLVVELAHLVIGTSAGTRPLATVALFAATLILVVVITIGLSSFTYRFIEAPMIVLGNRLLERPAPTLEAN